MEMSKSYFSLSAACSLWHTSAPLPAVPRCMGRSDGKTNAPLQSQTPCSPFRGLRRSGGTGRGTVRRRRQAASLSRCCGYGYRIVAVDGGRCVIQRRQQIFLDVADILPCSYIIILPSMHLPRIAFSGTAVIQQITQIKKKSPKNFRF